MAIFKNIFKRLRLYINYYIWQLTLVRDKRFKVLNRIYANIDGFKLSKSARGEQYSVQYVYGEIDFKAFHALLTLCMIDENTIFCDLGSGLGKPVMLAALFFPLKKAIGIEKFSSLFGVAESIKDTLVKMPGYEYIKDKTQFYNMDLLDYDISCCNLIFINIIGLTSSDKYKLHQNLCKLADKAYVITISKPLTSTNFTLLRECFLPVSWGVTKAYIHQKTSVSNP